MASLSELTRQRDRILRQLGRSTQQVSVDGTTTVAPGLKDQLAVLEKLEEDIAELQVTRPWQDFILTPPGPIGDFS
jgi:hypothetical protein